MVPFGEGMRPLHLFRRWSTQTQASSGSGGSGSSGHSAGHDPYSSGGNYFSGSGSGSGYSHETNPFRMAGYNRRWSVPASASNPSSMGETQPYLITIIYFLNIIFIVMLYDQQTRTRKWKEIYWMTDCLVQSTCYHPNLTLLFPLC